jgi:hypothetical protein
MMLVVEVAWIIWDDLLVQVVSGEIEEQKETILQAQLRWEKHRWEITADKKIPDIKHHCSKYLHNATKILIKMKSLSNEEKQALLKRIQLSSK